MLLIPFFIPKQNHCNVNFTLLKQVITGEEYADQTNDLLIHRAMRISIHHHMNSKQPEYEVSNDLQNLQVHPQYLLLSASSCPVAIQVIEE